MRINNLHSIRLPLDLLLLFLLVPSHLWFNPVSNALAVAFLILYLILTLVGPPLPDEVTTPRFRHRAGFTLRLTLVLFFVMLATLLPAGLNIAQRRAEGPETNAHDGMIQTEQAIEFLLEGKNPYAENYLDTPMSEWEGRVAGFEPTDSPLYHNAYLPALFLVSIPFYQLSHVILGWYDQRFVYLFLYAFLMLLLPLLVESQRNKLSLLIALGLNILFPLFLAEGRNDVVVLFWLVLATFFLARDFPRSAAVVLAIAVTTKHSAWFFLPFYFLYLLPEISWNGIRQALRLSWPFFLTVGLVVVPFLVGDAFSFVDDTFFYLVGWSEKSFPVWGMGFSVLLLASGILPAGDAPFPFLALELTVGLPVLWLMLRYQWRRNILARMWMGFAAFSLAVQYFSRFFNDNYLMFILLSFIIAGFISASPEPEKETVNP